MKWLLAIPVLCCGGLLLLTLVGANVGLITGIFLDNWFLILLGSLVVIAGVIQYFRRFR